MGEEDSVDGGRVGTTARYTGADGNPIFLSASEHYRFRGKDLANMSALEYHIHQCASV
jgi:hypothetical protein